MEASIARRQVEILIAMSDREATDLLLALGRLVGPTMVLSNLHKALDAVLAEVKRIPPA